jgi:hypothetical protein
MNQKSKQTGDYNLHTEQQKQTYAVPFDLIL